MNDEDHDQQDDRRGEHEFDRGQTAPVAVQPHHEPAGRSIASLLSVC